MSDRKLEYILISSIKDPHTRDKELVHLNNKWSSEDNIFYNIASIAYGITMFILGGTAGYLLTFY